MIRQGTAANHVTATPADVDWRHYAACSEENPDLFYGDKTADEVAKDTCQRCSVRQACLDWALKTRERHGVWGGLDEHERRRILRRAGEAKTQRGPGRAKAPCGTRAAYDRHRKNGEPIDEACATQGRYAKPLAGADAA